MIKHVIAVVALSIIVILTMSYAQSALEALVSAHNWISETLKQVFSGGRVGDVIRQLLALLAMPILIGLVPAIGYWITKRSWFPYFMELVWVVWLVETSALIIQYQLAVAA